MRKCGEGTKCRDCEVEVGKSGHGRAQKGKGRVGGIAYGDLEVELQAFAAMSIPHITMHQDAVSMRYFFHLFKGLCAVDTKTWQEHIYEKDGSTWLLLSCLQDIEA